MAALAQQDADNYGKGRFNTVLTLPLESVTSTYLTLGPDERYREISVEQHALDESVLAILPGVDVPQYQRM